MIAAMRGLFLPAQRQCRSEVFTGSMKNSVNMFGFRAFERYLISKMSFSLGELSALSLNIHLYNGRALAR